MDAAAIALALQLKVGDAVVAPRGEACARVSYIDLNPSGVAWAWLELPGPTPRNVVRVQLVQLRPCR